MDKNNLEEYIRNHVYNPYKDFIDEVEDKYGVRLSRHQIGRVLKGANLRMEELMANRRRDKKGKFLPNNPKSKTPQEQVGEDRLLRSLREGKKQTDKKYNVLLSEVERLEAELGAVLQLSEPTASYEITPISSSGKGEATAVVVASDWHIEERVTPAAINNLNEYSLDIAKKRATEFFQVALHLRDLEANNTPIPTMVLALLGDFITGSIHEENLAVCSVPPVVAAYEAKGLLKSGIDFLLKESDLNLIIPCHYGNHSRITKKFRSSETEMGNSLEYFIYGFLAQEYRDNPRVNFQISRSYTSQLKIYDTKLRLHHGHRIRYNGGIGGLSISANKYVLRANTSWNADMDVFGHFHQAQMSPRFICNGSLIGYNAYAQDSAFEFEPPSQTYFLINKRWKQIIDYRKILFSS